MRQPSLLALAIAALALAMVAACSGLPAYNANSAGRSSAAAITTTAAASSPSTTASATSAASQPPRPCAAGAVKIGPGPQLSPATGENGIMLSVTSVAPPCTVVGYPTVTMLDETGAPIHFTYVVGQGQYVTHRPPQPVTVGAGKLAYFLLAKYRCDTGSTTAAAGMTLVLPGQGTIRSVPTSWFTNGVRSFDFCTGGQNPDPGNTVDISPFEPAANLVGP